MLHTTEQTLAQSKTIKLEFAEDAIAIQSFLDSLINCCCGEGGDNEAIDHGQGGGELSAQPGQEQEDAAPLGKRGELSVDISTLKCLGGKKINCTVNYDVRKRTQKPGQSSNCNCELISKQIYQFGTEINDQ